ncbi:plasmid partitioning protein RepB [Aureimonas endophytica]|uniref:Plasmid partitioning protein RepB n=1 Tax=Aureimonas endophytica TaxID=2027858 RepID=A0A917E974_9HYPH|nr:plasmid partitioning protein RepB [Aureimonas endophytica]GGE11705.1 plasmid partitioning protein RepB [Aureimonas endophytica]
MSKRSKSLASIFAARPAEGELSADNAARVPRVSAGSVRSMKESFSQVERENEALRQSLAEGSQIVEVDPFLIDPSPFADRFPDDENSEAFEALKASIAENGQEIPVLLRVHPLDAARYQTAFGHRRVRAARALARPVRAVVRALDDEALAVAQGLENSARQDLTFIERAVFAARLEDSGRSRHVIQQALSVDKAEASKLIAIARGVPERVLRHVGRAPKIGRGRWLALAEALKDPQARARIERRMADLDRVPAESDARFTALLAAASATKAAPPTERSVIAHSGRRIASLIAGDRDARFVIDRDLGPSFAEFLAARLPALYEDYTARMGEGPEQE